MDKITFSIFLKILFLLNVISTIICEYCQTTENGFYVCESSDLLVLVNETHHKNQHLKNGKKFVYHGSRLKGIAANTFANNISIFEMELSFKKNSEIILNEDSFRGLKQTKVLKINSGYIPSVESLFKQIIYLDELELIVNENYPTLEIVLKNLVLLRTLKIHSSILNIVNTKLFSSILRIFTLEIKQCVITEIEASTFLSASFSSYLITLRLQNNNLKHLRPKTFNGLDKLETLEITGNNLEKIEYNVFYSLYNLRQLDISNNSIKYIDSRAFKGLNLIGLNLVNNNLKVIKFGMLEGLRTVHFDLFKNPLVQIEDNAFNNSNIEFIHTNNMDLLAKRSAYGLLKTTKIIPSSYLQ